MIYLIGSLRNPEVPKIAGKLRSAGLEVFDDWYAAGETADDSWRDYEKAKGNTYMQALQGYAAKNVFAFDKRHLDRASHVVLVLPAGKSGHLELGWSIGKGKRGYILLDSPDRWDVMYQFADMITDNLEDIIKDVCQEYTISTTKTPHQMPFMWDAPASGGILTPSVFASSVISSTPVEKPLTPTNLGDLVSLSKQKSGGN